MSRFSANATLTVTFIMALLPCLSFADDMPQPQQQAGITYMSGGIGDEEVEAMDSVKHNYKLRITSSSMSGAYPGDTHITITDHTGLELLSTDAGPIFYALLPVGRYTVRETVAGRTQKKSIAIAQNHPTLVSFRWRE